MTVSYQYEVASSTSGGFVRLLFRWRGSVWKLVYREILFFTTSYTILTLLYRFVLKEDQKRSFETIVYYCSYFMELIPLSFMLGFYVSFTATRWWSQYLAIPWPDKLMNIIAMYVPGVDETSRMMKRTLMRYLNLSLVLVLRSISMAVKRRFPTRDHLVEAGFLTKTELDMFESVPSTEFNTFWIPCTWFINLLRDARKDCRITDSNGVKLIMEELNEFRSKCGLLWSYDWISVPLVYTQVVTVATYAFYFACILGRQYVNSPDKIIQDKFPFDYYFPIFTVLQILFYMGLLKVAEQLINPFGDDDEDFELNWIIDRHLKVSYLGVDTLNAEAPPLVKDSYYDELDVKLPYTEASLTYKKKTYRGSVAYMQVPMEQQNLVLPDINEEDEKSEQLSMGSRRPSIWTIFGSKLNNSQRPSITESNVNVDADGLGDNTDIWKHSTSTCNVSSENIAQTYNDRKNSSGTGGTRDGDNGQESSGQEFSEPIGKLASRRIESRKGSHLGQKQPISSRKITKPVKSSSTTCLIKQQPNRNSKPYKSLFKKRRESVDQYYEMCRKWKMRSVSPCKEASEDKEPKSDPCQPQPSVQITVSSPPSNGEDTVKHGSGRLPPYRSTSLNVSDLRYSSKPKAIDRRKSYKEKGSSTSSSMCSQDTVMMEFHSMPNVQDSEEDVILRPDKLTKTSSKEDKKPVSVQTSREHKISRQNAIRRKSLDKTEGSTSSEDYKVPPELPWRCTDSPSIEAIQEEGDVKLQEKSSTLERKDHKSGKTESLEGLPKRSHSKRTKQSSKEQKRTEKKSHDLPRQKSSDSPTPYTTETSVSEGSKSSTTSIALSLATSTTETPDTVITIEHTGDRDEHV